MARLFLFSNLQSIPDDQLRSAMQVLFGEIEDQFNAGTDVISLTDGNLQLPQGMQSGDLVVKLERGELQIGLFNGKDVVYASIGSFTGAITDAQHGPRAGGTLHPAATTAVAGFMSATDKIKSDHYKGDTTSATPASITQYPNNGDWGYHTDTGGGTYSLAKNKGGTIFTVLLT